jgi:hypothetical protein
MSLLTWVPMMAMMSKNTVTSQGTAPTPNKGNAIGFFASHSRVALLLLFFRLSRASLGQWQPLLH